MGSGFLSLQEESGLSPHSRKPCREQRPACSVCPGSPRPHALDRPVKHHLMGLAGLGQVAWNLLGDLELSGVLRTKPRAVPASRRPPPASSASQQTGWIYCREGASSALSLAFPAAMGCGLHSGAAHGKWHPLCLLWLLSVTDGDPLTTSRFLVTLGSEGQSCLVGMTSWWLIVVKRSKSFCFLLSPTV